MSFQGYLDTIKEKTGKGPDDFRALARAKGLEGPDVKAGAVVQWLGDEFGLGRGHAMAIYGLLKHGDAPRASRDDRVAKLFAGGKAVWREPVEALIEQAKAFGDDVAVDPSGSYASLTRGGKKFAILAPGASRLDVGVKRKGVAPEGRFEAAGSWNAMVTHRVRVADAAELDGELMDWLRAAYEAAK